MIDLIDRLPPGVILIVGALLLPLLRGRWQQTWLLILPLLSAAQLAVQVFNHWAVIIDSFVGIDSPAGFQIPFSFFGYDLAPVHLDRLSLVWGCIFHIAALVSALYALHVKDSVQHVSALIYVGAAIGAVFAGDLITLFVYWELTAVSSVFLIWASRTERSYRAGMRYLIVQVGSGVLLLAGILFHVAQSHSLAFDRPFYKILNEPTSDGVFLGLHSLGTVLIFIAFGIKAAFPLLHNWLTDAYPEATPTGTVFLSAFTTKLAIYTLARGFPGTEVLIYIGATMTAFPIFYAVIENDLRRVLAYSLNNQLGFMVVGIGLANFAEHPEVASLALNGTASHAFAHILYKALLFMSMGAVLMRTGTIKGSELGGLYKSMPWTTGFCIVGAASISAFPLFSGFVTKSMILSACAQEHHTIVWLVLLFASAGVFHHSGIKIPFFAFFAHDSGRRVKEAPWNMLLAMGIAAALCILIGVVPGPLYAILPCDVHFHAYDATHVITQLQLLLWSALAFTVLNRTGIYPPELRSVNLDTDWLFRRPFIRTGSQSLSLAETIYALAGQIRSWADARTMALLNQLLSVMRRLFGPGGMLPKTWSISAMVVWAAILLTAYLLLYYVSI